MDQTEQEILQRNLINYIISDVFNAPTKEETLRIVSNKEWFHKGKPLSDGQIKQLKAEVSTFIDSSLWKVMRDESMYQAHLRGYVQSKTEADMIAGKLLHYFIDMWESKFKDMLK